MQVLPESPYHDGRFTNGPVWAEYAAKDLNASLKSLAVGGATTGAYQWSASSLKRGVGQMSHCHTRVA